MKLEKLLELFIRLITQIFKGFCEFLSLDIRLIRLDTFILIISLGNKFCGIRVHGNILNNSGILLHGLLFFFLIFLMGKDSIFGNGMVPLFRQEILCILPLRCAACQIRPVGYGLKLCDLL